ncbi:MAG: hypothetical protein A3G24_27225, partial [Betaproteobacteria bacterium RIFCSPLOWO2_12_FULL_62_13]
MNAVDLAVIGAGPAGLAAAITAAELGLKTVVFDEQPEPGGQIYRGVERVAAVRPAHLPLLGEDYAAGLQLVRRFRACAADYRPLAAVWQIDRELRVHYRDPGGTGHVEAKQVIIATGALERPMAVPGWTLPGVMTCGAAQTLLKSAALVPAGRVVLAGGGPLLLLLASQLVRAGAKPAAVLETRTNPWPALRHAARFVMAPGYLSKGLSMIGALRAAGVPIRRGVSKLRLIGTSGVERVAAVRPAHLPLLGEDYAAGLQLVRRFRACAADYRPLAAVWQIDRELRVHYRDPGGTGHVEAKQVIIATGALERPMAVPGWTLPGVMTCGAAQTLLKSAALVPAGRVVLAGGGPLLLLLASQLVRAGAKPAAVLETRTNPWPALRHAARFVMAPGYLSKGLSMIGALRAAGVPIRRGVSKLRLIGTNRVERVSYEWKGAKRQEPVDLVLLHQGVVPN